MIKDYNDKHVVLCMGVLNAFYVSFSDHLLHIMNVQVLT